MVLPWALTAVVVGVMWRWILLPDIGIVNYMLSGLGINVSFFLSPGLALATMIVVEVWRSTGYGMILVLAGLQGIDGTLYEAARIDGAGFWRALRHITLPLLVPTLLVATILLSIRSVNLIDIPLVVTGGGPARMTETLGPLHVEGVLFLPPHRLRVGGGHRHAGHQPPADRAVHPSVSRPRDRR